MFRLKKLIPVWIRPTGSDDFYGLLHSVDRMHAILERERLRSDRGHSVFALLTLTLSKCCDRRELADLARIVRDRIRITDDAGLLDPRRIGVVLSETPAAGAWKLAEDICDLLPAESRRPKCAVYVYPFDPAQRDVDTAVEVDQPMDSREARPMQVLFVRSLPAWKRVIDVIGAGTALVLTVPLLLLVAVAVKITSRGPVFFIQQRDGLGRRRFWLYKFRTMVANADAIKADLRSMSEQDGPAFKLRNDPRVTPIGSFLRRTSIDELPQFWNVLKGDMSLVGPRPLPCDESAACVAWQKQRLSVTPGLTCIWQVKGRSQVTFDEWMGMDLRYIRSRGFWHDMKLLLQTILVVLRQKGAY